MQNEHEAPERFARLETEVTGIDKRLGGLETSFDTFTTTVYRKLDAIASMRGDQGRVNWALVASMIFGSVSVVGLVVGGLVVAGTMALSPVQQIQREHTQNWHDHRTLVEGWLDTRYTKADHERDEDQLRERLSTHAAWIRSAIDLTARHDERIKTNTHQSEQNERELSEVRAAFVRKNELPLLKAVE